MCLVISAGACWFLVLIMLIAWPPHFRVWITNDNLLSWSLALVTSPFKWLSSWKRMAWTRQFSRLYALLVVIATCLSWGFAVKSLPAILLLFLFFETSAMLVCSLDFDSGERTQDGRMPFSPTVYLWTWEHHISDSKLTNIHTHL